MSTSPRAAASDGTPEEACGHFHVMPHSAVLGHVEVPVTYSKDEAVGLMQAAGIVGAGGAGFPTYVKWQRPPGVLLVNGADSEPGYYKDKLLMRDEPEAHVDIIEYLIETFSLDAVVVAAEDVARPYMTELEGLARKLHEFSVAYIEPKYKYGQEKALCRAVFGMDIPQKDLPPEHGVVVNNNETLFNMYRAEFEERPVTTKFLHVYGEGAPLAVYEAPIGTLACDLLRLHGTDPAQHAECTLYDGGPILAERVAAPMGPEPLYAVHRTTNALLVVDPSKERGRSKQYPDPSWHEHHNTADAPWAPAEIVNVEDRVGRVCVPRTGAFWTGGPLAVSPGEHVARGDVLAPATFEGRSLAIHASIDGTVRSITDEYVEIVQ